MIGLLLILAGLLTLPRTIDPDDGNDIEHDLNILNATMTEHDDDLAAQGQKLNALIHKMEQLSDILNSQTRKLTDLDTKTTNQGKVLDEYKQLVAVLRAIVETHQQDVTPPPNH